MRCAPRRWARCIPTAQLKPQLRLGDKIQKLRIKLHSLKAVEDKQKSMSLTMADLQALGEKGEIEERRLEVSSRAPVSKSILRNLHV